jgi:hypothetical protein
MRIVLLGVDAATTGEGKTGASWSESGSSGERERLEGAAGGSKGFFPSNSLRGEGEDMDMSSEFHLVEDVVAVAILEIAAPERERDRLVEGRGIIRDRTEPERQIRI